MAQVVLLGLGGTGSRVVNNVAAELRRNNIPYNDGNICCAVLDTNRNDQDLIEATGTGIPVIPTSGALNVGDIINKHSINNILEWCPTSKAFEEETFADGASELRVKSRLAFMESVTNGQIRELETNLAGILHLKGDEKIRVLLVTSLSGGTGSGMFLQTALWIRNFFEERRCDVSIRGIMLLPDIFVQNLNSVRGNKTKSTRHYANAYAAIRELNAITKMKRYPENYKPAKRIRLGDHFDSDNPGSSKPVFDVAYFIDNVDERGVSFDETWQYENMVSQAVYMQLFAPMATDLRSVEDNQFITNFTSENPLYGSCGTAKAVYPTADVVRYCALKAAKKSITSGWRAIDNEIESYKDDLEAKKASGVRVETNVETSKEYVKRFDSKANKTESDSAGISFFKNVRADTVNTVSNVGKDNKSYVSETDKVADFIAQINGHGGMIAEALSSRNGLKTLPLSSGDEGKEWLDETHTVDDLGGVVEAKQGIVISEIADFNVNYRDIASDIVDTVFPLSMGETGKSSERSIYGLLTKKTEDGKAVFVHPVAARYMLYKLCNTISDQIISDDYSQLERAAKEGYGFGNEEVSFDNLSTKGEESSPMEFLESRVWYQSERSFIADFKARYANFNKAQVTLLKKYETTVLTNEIFKGIKEILLSLIANFEKFFEDLDQITGGIDKAINVNIAKNNDTANKVLYVCASEDDKESIYNSLKLDVDLGSAEVNESVIKAAYGKLCADRRPKITENKDYIGVRVSENFLRDTVLAYSKIIKTEHSSKVCLSIYQAICLEADLKAERKAKAFAAQSETDPMLEIDAETLKVVNNDRPDPTRHREALLSTIRKVERFAAPFLLAEVEVPEDGPNLIPLQDGTSVYLGSYNDLVFWGFNPKLAEEVKDIGKLLLINPKTQMGAYGIDELLCYHGKYGVAAGKIPKFNEKTNGEYYKSYITVLTQMLRANAANNNEVMSVISPHLDKTWHDVLPYVSPEMDVEKDRRFYRAFLLGLAYGKIVLDKEGNFAVNKVMRSGFTSGTTLRPVYFDGRAISKTAIPRLITALREDSLFMIDDIPQIEATYKEDLASFSKFHNTALYAALTGGADDLNVVTVITRYDHAGNISQHEKDGVRIQLMATLDIILEELIAHYDESRDKSEIVESRNALRKKVFDGCRYSSEHKYETFADWGIKKPSAGEENV